MTLNYKHVKALADFLSRTSLDEVTKAFAQPLDRIRVYYYWASDVQTLQDLQALCADAAFKVKTVDGVRDTKGCAVTLMALQRFQTDRAASALAPLWSLIQASEKDDWEMPASISAEGFFVLSRDGVSTFTGCMADEYGVSEPIVYQHTWEELSA